MRTSRLDPWPLVLGALCFPLLGCGPAAAPPPQDPVVVAATATATDPTPPPAGGDALAADPQEEGYDAKRADGEPAGAAREHSGGTLAAPGDGSAFVPDPSTPIQEVSTGPYAKGRALAFMPRDCDEKFYVDVAGLAGQDRAELALLIDQLVKWAGGMGAQQQANGVLATLRSAGLDPARALHEIAACDQPDMAVLGFESSKPVDPLVTAQRVLVSLGERPGVIERRGAYRVLSERPGAGEAVVDVRPGVLLLVDRWRDGEQALAAARGLDGFAAASKSLLYIEADDTRVVIDDKGRQLDVNVRVSVGRPTADGRKAAQHAALEIKREMAGVADRLAKSPLRSLSGPLRAVRVSAQGSDVVGQGSLTRANLAEALRAIGSMSPPDLEALIEGRAPSGGKPLQAP